MLRWFLLLFIQLDIFTYVHCLNLNDLNAVFVLDCAFHVEAHKRLSSLICSKAATSSRVGLVHLARVRMMSGELIAFIVLKHHFNTA